MTANRATLFVAALATLLPLACSSPQKQVRKIVLGLERAIEERDLLKVAGFLSADYKDPYGQGRAETLGLFKLVFQDFDAIELSLGTLEPQIGEDAKTASLAFDVTVQVKVKRTDQVEEQAFRVTMKLRKEDRHWRVTSASTDEPLRYP